MNARRGRQATSTRELLLHAAEQLFSEHGIDAVSNRQISEAAGQANNYAVGYHFGTREGLLRTLLESHNRHIDDIRRQMVDEIGENSEVRDWLRCLAVPQLKYLGEHDGPTYFAQFCAQMESNPATVGLLYEQAATSEPLMAILQGLDRTLPELPDDVVPVRNLMTRNLLVATFADFERTRNESDTADAETWSRFGSAMVDALVGLWLAPVT